MAIAMLTDQRRQTILLVGEQAEARQVLEGDAPVQTVTVLSAGSGHEALTVARQARPDLAIIELDLPDVCGARVLRGFREVGVPVIVATRTGSPRTVRLAMESGVLEYLTKPVGCDELRRTIRQALALAKKKRPNPAVS